MTLRLVALMSVVLLLSLAAVGLLITHYQEQFMKEVQTTASDVGQATLRTLEWSAGPTPHAGKGFVLRRAPDTGEEGEEGSEPRLGVIVAEIEGGAIHERVGHIRHVITTSTEDEAFTVSEQLVYPAGAFPSVLPGEAFQEEFEACLQGRIEEMTDEVRQVFINVEAVHAEADPLGGIVLKIPTRAAEGEMKEGVSGNATVDFKLDPQHGVLDRNVFLTRQDEIQLPIGGNYGELFGKLRNRSLFLFMGVFLVGMVLSTGLASRFTRPVRKLDAGIRRLSEGDLDVTVAGEGKGEIGRLARTFNEMAAKLRVSREREREMVRREKLSALGRLAAGVAHDVRNPLHSIGLTLQHLSETSRPDTGEQREEFDRSLDVIRGEIGRLDQLVGNFLSFAKSERRDRQPVDLGDLLGETVRLVQKESERRNVRIDFQVAESMPTVRVDAEAIRSALLNLILNSFEAMPEGGELTLKLHTEQDEVVLEVADTGEGIPQAEQEHVFDFAYTTRETGSGLGLAMVHHCVVEEHAGSISLESRPGKGTRVRLALPTRNGETA
jgi:signal transduction histidine kinase